MTDKHGKTTDYDEVMEYIGQFGRYQRKVFLWLGFASAATGLAFFTFNFTAYIPRYRVRTDCDAEGSGYYLDDSSATLPDWLSQVQSFEVEPSLQLHNQECRMPSVVRDASGKCVSAFFTNQSLELTSANFDQIIFDRSVRRSTLIEEFNMVCDRSFIRPYMNSVYVLGMLVGSYLFGFVSDRLGRLKALVLAITCVSLSGTIGAFCTGPVGQHAFAFFRFLTGLGNIGMFMSAFVLSVEHVGYKFTMLIGIAYGIPFALGEAIHGLQAFLLRDWFPLQIVAYSPIILAVGLYYVVPESTRWLLAHGKLDEAKKNIRDACNTNGRQIPSRLLEAIDAPRLSEITIQTQKNKLNVLDLFKTKEIFFRTANMAFQWFSAMMCSYGLTSASTSLSGNIYANFMLSCLIEIPGSLFCILLMDVWGRRSILAFCQIISGVSCLILGLLSVHKELAGLQILLSLMGKFGATSSFSIVYVYTAELFPTPVRHQAMGVCSLISRIGGMMAPLLNLFKQFWGPAPVFIMGCFASTAGLCVLLLPETVGQKLPDTMEEALRIDKNSKRRFCQCTYVSPKHLYKETYKQVDEDGLKH